MVKCISSEILGKKIEVNFLKVWPGVLTFSSDFIGTVCIVVYFYAQT